MNSKNDHPTNPISSTKEDEITIVNPEVIEGKIYTGKIISIHAGYVFIGEVKRAYETINTNGDIFCPIPENAEFQIGQTVSFFNLNQDEKRAGKFRTESISVLDLAVSSNNRNISLMQLVQPDSPYHNLKKNIEQGDIETAADNQPLRDFIVSMSWMLNHERGFDPERLLAFTEDFILKTFPALSPVGVTYSVKNDVDINAEKKMINNTVKMYNENGLAGQAESLQKEYSQFIAVREAFSMMVEVNLLRPDTVIDIKYLPELTYAFPVWYVSAKGSLPDNTTSDDPQPDHAIKFISDAVGSQEFAWFYQIYNRRTRPLSQFKGKDIIPPALVKIMKRAQEAFDYVAILTPYHDTASKEWSDPNWLRNIDPLMVGMLKGLPYVFVLGRWSGTGIFPLLLDCIADTSNHLKLNKHLLNKFPANSYWYKGLSGGCLTSMGGHDNTVLEPFAGMLLKAYENGKLFEFLRGELSEDADYTFFHKFD
jgi:hypothetical protein